MALHLTYIELAWFFGMLSTLRLLFQFVIKMIAIFARDEFSTRAFKVLNLSRRDRRAAISHTRTSDKPRMPYSQVEAVRASRAEEGTKIQRRIRASRRR
ncbi:MAG: hypothetical protein ACRDP7_48370 [Trebonia sp.]